MKKKILKKLSALRTMLKRIDQHNEYLYDNKYSVRHGSPELSYNVKIYEWLSDSDVQKVLNKLELDDDIEAKVLEEFDDDRLSGILNHFLTDQAEMAVEDFDQWDGHPLYDIVRSRDVSFYGRQGGHMCLGEISEFEKNAEDILGDYPIWSNGDWIVDDDTFIDICKEHFGFTNQKQVYDFLCEIDFEYYTKEAQERLDAFTMFEQQIQDFKDNAATYLFEQLETEIGDFIDMEFGIEMAVEKAERGNHDKLNTFRIQDDTIITNMNAIVKLDAAIALIKAIVIGADVVDKKIGAFKVNKVVKKENDTYVKIGCHLFSIKQSLQSLGLSPA